MEPNRPPRPKSPSPIPTPWDCEDWEGTIGSSFLAEVSNLLSTDRRDHLNFVRYFVFGLTIAVLIAAGSCAFAALNDLPTRSTPGDANVSKLMELIAGRGLIQSSMPDPRASGHIPAPLPGSSVSESVVALSNDGERVSHVTLWEEPLTDGFLDLQETIAEAGQTNVEYWALTSDHRRCLLNGEATYGQDGRLLSSNFWRNDPQLRYPGSARLPNDIFPSRIPPSAFLPALNDLKPGATGKLHVVLGRYGQMSFDLWAQDVEQIVVPAGAFRTLKIIMRVDAESVMQYWPRFLRRLAQPFFPKNALYFDTAPPHHLIQFVGSFGYMAPEVTVKLTRSYLAAGSERKGRSQSNDPTETR